MRVTNSFDLNFLLMFLPVVDVTVMFDYYFVQYFGQLSAVIKCAL